MFFGFLALIGNYFCVKINPAALNYPGVTILTCLILLQNYKSDLTLDYESPKRL